jgi:hypothetical protein
VRFSLGGTPVAATRADASGRFDALVRLPSAPVGRHLLDGTCGDTRFESPIDLVVSTAGGAAVVSMGAAAGAVLSFFVLLALILSQGRGAPPSSYREE